VITPKRNVVPGDVDERAPDDGGVGRQPRPDDHDLAAGHRRDLGGARVLEQLEDLLGGLVVGVDDQVDAHGVVQGHLLARAQVGVLEPAHAAVDAGLLGHEA
jgi:hypothetical protein